MAEPLGKEESHLDFLDHFRGLAVLAVYLFHCLGAAYGRDQLPWSSLGRSFEGSGSFLLFLPITLFLYGVAAFFAVSGFCIHLSFARKQPADWTAFAIRRFFRIFPPYLAALLFFAFVLPATRLVIMEPGGWQQFTSHLLLIHNFDERWFYGFNPAFWSIAVEFQLYAIYPLLLVVTRRFGWHRALLILAALELTLRLGSGFWHTATGADFPRAVTGSPFYFWFSWAAGAAVAEDYLKGRVSAFARWPQHLILIAAVGCAFLKPLAELCFPLFALWTTVLIAKGCQKPARFKGLGRGAISPALQMLGLWSYSLYLFHQPLIWTGLRNIEKLFPSVAQFPLLKFALGIALLAVILPVSALAYRLLEVPAIALGRTALSGIRARIKSGKLSAANLSE